MPTHQNHQNRQTYYFVTFTCYRWLSLIEKSQVYDFFPKWLREINRRGVLNCGYVFMPNHIHLLVYVHERSKGLNHVIGEAKRFLAYEIVTRLKQKGETHLLNELAKGVQGNEKLKGKKHQVFRLSFDAKEIRGAEDINLILDYIHHNAVSGKWNLAENFMDYTYSSARYYELGEPSDVKVYHYLDVLDISEFPSDNSEGL